MEDKVKQIYKELLGDYCPDKDLDLIVNFMYKSVKNPENISPMDKFMFMKSVREISLAVSKNVIMTTLDTTLSRVKHMVNSIKISKNGGNISNTMNDGYTSAISEDFEIDLDSITNVGVKKDKPNQLYRESNEFELDTLEEEFSKFNQSKAEIKSIEDNNTEKVESVEDATDSGFQTDASIFNGEYTDTPKVSVTLDY